MDKRKTTTQLEREIQSILAGDVTLFYPGGSGGGGSRRKRPGKPVVKPHAKTSASCRECSRLHSLEQHAAHGDATTKPAIKKIKKPTKSKTKATKKTKVKAKVKSIKKKTTRINQAPVQRPPIGKERRDERWLDLVREAVREIPDAGRYGDEKVFIAAIYDWISSRTDMSMADFKRWLIDQNRQGNLFLARADLVGAMDPDMVRRSEIESLGATFHFVLAGSVK